MHAHTELVLVLVFITCNKSRGLQNDKGKQQEQTAMQLAAHTWFTGNDHCAATQKPEDPAAACSAPGIMAKSTQAVSALSVIHGVLP